MENKKVNSTKPAAKDIRRTVENIEAHAAITASDDCRLMKIIYEAFDGLSVRGKGVCVEQLVRELTQYATGDK